MSAPILRLPPVLSKLQPHAEASDDSQIYGRMAAVSAPVSAPAETERPWLDKAALAGHFSCSVRWVEQRMEDGMPHAQIAGRVKFRLSDVTRWLTENGHIDHRGEAVK